MLDRNILAAGVMNQCDALAAISAESDGISRFYLTEEHQRCNELVAQWLQAAGMRTWTDAAGNLWGRYEGQRPDAKALLLGSHLDSIPNAGRYDGILGVLVAIAAVEALHQQQIQLPFAIEIVGFGDEEGTRFGSTLLGSRAVAGTWNENWWSLADRDGITLADAFRKFGLAPENIDSAARESADFLAYLEVHIEQGPVLEDTDHALGIVTSIAGARRFTVDVEGFAGHAGTVPMHMRKDALLTAALGVELIDRYAREHGVVATVGQLACWPGAVNVIPGRARFSIDIRSGDDHLRDQTLKQIQQAFEALCHERHVTCSWTEIHNAPAVQCAQWMQELQAQVREDMHLEAVTLMSGAGHDAMAIADITDVAMYFVRCKGGVSHHPAESVMVEDVALAIEALNKTLVRIAQNTGDESVGVAV